jgi:hypothetical protein
MLIYRLLGLIQVSVSEMRTGWLASKLEVAKHSMWIILRPRQLKSEALASLQDSEEESVPYLYRLCDSNREQPKRDSFDS